MRSLQIKGDAQYLGVTFDNDLVEELIQNVKYFEYPGTIQLIQDIVGKSYDAVSFFRHDDGKHYAVVHTVFGIDFKHVYTSKLSDITWDVSIDTPAYKRTCVKDYMKENDCDTDFIFCIMDHVPDSP